jgi:hypothetical protein
MLAPSWPMRRLIVTTMLPKNGDRVAFLSWFQHCQSQCKASPGQVLVPIRGQATRKATMAFTAPRGHINGTNDTGEGHRLLSEEQNVTIAWGQTPRGHQRHGGTGPRTTATGAGTSRGYQRHGGTGPRAIANGSTTLEDHHGLHGLRWPHLANRWFSIAILEWNGKFQL